MEKRDLIIYLAIKHCGDWEQIYRALHVDSDFDDEETVMDTTRKLRCGVITILDEGYPESLLTVIRPPFALFYYGNISLIKDTDKNLGVVGTRDPTDFGLKTTREMVEGLKKHIVVVSGLAEGIDGCAHETALDCGHNTIAVLGSGVNICFPSTNRDLYAKIYYSRSSLIISEYPPGVPPKANNFPVRNRIIAGLSKCLLVTEARRRSGTSITVSYALERGMNVLCVPSSDLKNSTCNLCIKDGGYLVETAEDINAFY